MQGHRADARSGWVGLRVPSLSSLALPKWPTNQCARRGCVRHLPRSPAHWAAEGMGPGSVPKWRLLLRRSVATLPRRSQDSLLSLSCGFARITSSEIRKSASSDRPTSTWHQRARRRKIRGLLHRSRWASFVLAPPCALLCDPAADRPETSYRAFGTRVPAPGHQSTTTLLLSGKADCSKLRNRESLGFWAYRRDAAGAGFLEPLLQGGQEPP